METLKNRCELSSNDCWDLTKIIKDEAEYQALINLVKKKNKDIVALKGRILDSSETLLQYLKDEEEADRAYSRLILYTKMSSDEDTRDNERKTKLLEVRKLGDMIREEQSFVISEFMEKDLEDVIVLLQEKEELKEYKLYFERLYRDKKRILSEKEEAIIALAEAAFGTSSDAFNSLDNADCKFESIKIDGKEIPLTHYNYPLFLENKDQKIRQEAFLKYNDFYNKHKNTFASLLKGNYQELEFLRKIRKYDNALEMALDNTAVNPKVYDNLICNVHKYMDLNIEFQKIKASLLGNLEYHLYDTYVPVVAIPEKKYTKDEAIDLVKNALKPLGEDYLRHFQSIFDDHTVDFYSNEGKHNGAYQWSCYDTPSYVLLNFNGTMDSVSTLAHELGHGVHSMYSTENNSYLYYSYEIFLAEIASTVNETLLSQYLLKNAKSKKEKMYFLCKFLDKVKATIYRSAMFSEFEKIMSEKCQNGESLTEENFSSTYYELNKKYFKDSVIIDELIRYEEYRIFHFYRPFYVYQYATGLICAIFIAQNILNEEEGYRDKYLAFLKSGSNQDALDILKIVDIDLTIDEPFEKAFSFIKEMLEELKDLIKEGEEDE